MKIEFDATTKKGTSYLCRLIVPGISKLGEIPYSALVEICVDDAWYSCEAMTAYEKNVPVPVINIKKENTNLRAALDIQHINGDVKIGAPTWPAVYEEMGSYLEAGWREEANSAQFSEIQFIWHSSRDYMCFDWNSDLCSDYIPFSDQMNEIKQLLSLINHHDLKEYCTGEDIGDYTTESYYTFPISDLDELKEMAAPGLKELKEKQKKNEEHKRIVAERDENIKAGAVYFICESKPHAENLTNVILTRPCPNNGTFLLYQNINNHLFARIKQYGRYYDHEFLEDCDMFCSPTGWR
ncbi:MAG: hypothetical protein RRY36_07765, partial [Bacteroidaceae bacterium]